MSCAVAAVRADDRARVESRAIWCIASLLMIVVLLAPAIWNGFALLEYDTGGYLARWFEGYLVPSRPGAYGLLLAAAVRFQFWPVLIAQAGATIWILALLMRELGVRDRPLVLAGLVSLLAVVTTLPWLASILLTDIFAGLAVLAIYLLLFGENVSIPERWALGAFVAFAAASHSATLALVAILVCVVVALPRGIISPARVRDAAVTLLLAVMTTLGANAVISGRLQFTPGGYGIVFGRMLEDGIVSRYLDDHCPGASLKLCPFRTELPPTADEFLWDNGVFNRLGRFDGLADEMRSIVLGSLREYPLLQAKAALRATAMQLARVATGEGVVNTLWHTYAIMERYAPAAAPAMRRAYQQRGELHFNLINHIHVPVALLAFALLPAVIAARWRRPQLNGLSLLAATIAVSVLANAFVCGALSNPHDRYGARLTWLAPLALMLVPVCLRRRPQGRDS
ncbi:MAG TPA: hypothetical protein VIH98_14435 [Xanthobacteraceae bacterium]